jgi:hypothetical protein
LVELSALRAWLLASQILLASGAVAVVIGAVGTVRFTAARERLIVAQALAHPKAAVPAAPPPDPAQIAALKAENLALQQRLTGAEQNLTAAQAATHQLEAALPRRLTEAQKATLLAALKSIPGPPEVTVFTLSDPEAGAYADQIVKIIDAAGYRGQVKNLGAPAPPPKGLRLLVKPGDTKGAAIGYAFQAVKIPVIIAQGDPGAFDIAITIGVKP